jgi:hypothetical protein
MFDLTHQPTTLFWYLGFHANAILNFINTGNVTANICEVGSEFNILCTLVTTEGSHIFRPNSPRLEGGSPSQKVHSRLGIFKMAAVAMETVNVCQNV